MSEPSCNTAACQLEARPSQNEPVVRYRQKPIEVCPCTIRSSFCSRQPQRVCAEMQMRKSANRTRESELSLIAWDRFRVRKRISVSTALFSAPVFTGIAKFQTRVSFFQVIRPSSKLFWMFAAHSPLLKHPDSAQIFALLVRTLCRRMRKLPISRRGAKIAGTFDFIGKLL